MKHLPRIFLSLANVISYSAISPAYNSFFLLSTSVFDPFHIAFLNSSMNFAWLCFDYRSSSISIFLGCCPISFFCTYSILLEYILFSGGYCEIVIETCSLAIETDGFYLLHFQIHYINGSSMKTSQKSIITFLLSCNAEKALIIACLKIP